MIRADPPKVTIGILCFNAEATIARAVLSAVEQDYPNTEIIVVDDRSSDGSLDILNEMARENEIHLIKHSHNLGPGAARNSVIDSASGDFVAFFDDDDVACPNRVSVQLNTILEFEVILKTKKISCYASGKRHYPNGYTVDLPAIGSSGKTPPHGVKMAKSLLVYERESEWFYGAGTPTCALMARLSFLQEIGGFDPKFRRVEDIDLAVRMALAGAYFLGSRIHQFDQFATDASDKSPMKNLEAEQYLVRKHQVFLEELGLYKYALRWPKLRYWHFTRNYFRFFVDLCRLLSTNPMRTVRQLFTTGPKRLIHEARMRRK